MNEKFGFIQLGPPTLEQTLVHLSKLYERGVESKLAAVNTIKISYYTRSHWRRLEQIIMPTYEAWRSTVNTGLSSDAVPRHIAAKFKNTPVIAIPEAGWGMDMTNQMQAVEESYQQALDALEAIIEKLGQIKPAPANVDDAGKPPRAARSDFIRGNFKIYGRELTISYRDTVIPLEPKQRRVLSRLIRTKSTVHYDDLFQVYWQDDSVKDQKFLDQAEVEDKRQRIGDCISKIKKALIGAGADPGIIKNYPKNGYKLLD